MGISFSEQNGSSGVVSSCLQNWCAVSIDRLLQLVGCFGGSGRVPCSQQNLNMRREHRGPFQWVPCLPKSPTNRCDRCLDVTARETEQCQTR